MRGLLFHILCLVVENLKDKYESFVPRFVYIDL